MRPTTAGTIDVDGRRERLQRIDRSSVENAGLLLDRWLEAIPLRSAAAATAGEEDAREAIRRLCESAEGLRVPRGYTGSLTRRRSALEGFQGGFRGGRTLLRRVETTGRLVIGLGGEAIRENSLALLRPWGVPYLPGSALKGLAAAVAHRTGDACWSKGSTGQPMGEDHALLFGGTDRQGCVLFHDAWWEPTETGGTMPLALDVMTVHHPEYYRDGQTPPADWDEPNPVSFLTSHGRYLLALTGPEGWVERALELLLSGLEHDGLGAKSAAGYGRMRLASDQSAPDLPPEDGTRETWPDAFVRYEPGSGRLEVTPGNGQAGRPARGLATNLGLDDAARDRIRRGTGRWSATVEWRDGLPLLLDLLAQASETRRTQESQQRPEPVCITAKAWSVVPDPAKPKSRLVRIRTQGHGTLDRKESGLARPVLDLIRNATESAPLDVRVTIEIKESGPKITKVELP